MAHTRLWPLPFGGSPTSEAVAAFQCDPLPWPENRADLRSPHLCSPRQREMPHSTGLTAMIRAYLLCDPEICNHRPALELRESLLPALLILANGTGRRISAICSLRFADLRLGVGPHGSIRWPADTDKMGVESVVPITTDVREVLDRIQREQPGMGAPPLFPSSGNPRSGSTPPRFSTSRWTGSRARTCWRASARSGARCPPPPGRPSTGLPPCSGISPIHTDTRASSAPRRAGPRDPPPPRR